MSRSTVTAEERARVAEHLKWNFHPAGEREPSPHLLAVACRAIGMVRRGRSRDLVPGAHGDCAGQVVDNLHLDLFAHHCHWCNLADPHAEYCRQCGGCSECCSYPAHTTCCGIPPDIFSGRQDYCLCGDEEPRWFDQEDKRFHSTEELFKGRP